MQRNYGLLVRKRRWLATVVWLAVSLFGSSLAAHNDESRVAQQDAQSPATMEPMLARQDVQDFDIEELLATPVVESAVLREQSLHDAPASVTVITAAELMSMAVTSIPDALRRVVGVHVIQNHARDYSVGLRGFTNSLNDRVLVLVDGLRLDEPLLGAIRWQQLPAALHDIERIEVLRGPGSSLYGANAFSGVINIVTKSGLDHPGIEATAFGGTNFLPDIARDDPTSAMLKGRGNANLSFGWANEERTLGLRIGAGYTAAPEWLHPPARVLATHGTYGLYVHAGVDVARVHGWDLKTRWSHAQNESLLGRGTVAHPVLTDFFDDTLVVDASNAGLLDGLLRITLHLDGRREGSTAGAVTRAGDRTTQDTLNYRGRALLLGDLALFEGRNTLSLGLETTRYVETIPVFDVEPERLQTALLLQNETRLLADERLVINVGARLERIAGSDGRGVEAVYRHLSPRGAVTYRLGNDQSLRLAAATAFRTPAGFENFVSVRVPFEPPPAPEITLAPANPRLQPERVVTVELGYRGRVFESVRADSVIFMQRIDDRVDWSRASRFPVRYGNRGIERAFGFELGTAFAIAPSFSGYANYTMTWSQEKATREPAPIFPMHLASIGANQMLPFDSRICADLTIASAYRPEFRAIPEKNLELSNERLATQVIVNVKAAHSILDGHAEVFLLGTNLQGLARGRRALRQYVSPETVSPIGASVILGVTVVGK